MAKLLVANWKMHPDTAIEAVKIAKASDATGVVLCPPFPFLAPVGETIKKASLGAQDVFWEHAGAFTGEVSAAELQSVRAKYIIVGHSERRALGETDEQVAKKVSTVLAEQLIPILCVGELRAEHEAGRTNETIDRQLRSALSLIPVDAASDLPTVYIAYEPVWAISTNQVGAPRTATPADVQGVIHYMQGILRGMPITPVFLYGGSVGGDTLAGFLAIPEVGGALVGAASLRAAEFKKMIAVAAAAYH